MDTETKKTLDLRLIKGEITKVQYDEILKTISGRSGNHASFAQSSTTQAPTPQAVKDGATWYLYRHANGDEKTIRDGTHWLFIIIFVAIAQLWKFKLYGWAIAVLVLTAVNNVVMRSPMVEGYDGELNFVFYGLFLGSIGAVYWLASNFPKLAMNKLASSGYTQVATAKSEQELKAKS